jgi:hypothetical protein
MFITWIFEIYHPYGITLGCMVSITRIDIRAYKYGMPKAFI